MRTGPLIRLAVISVVTAMTALLVPAAVAAPAPRETGRTPEWEVSSAGRLTWGSHLRSVTAAGRNAAWAVGSQSAADSGQEGVLLRWDGRGWDEDRAPGLPEADHWISVSAAAPDDVWAYGWKGQEDLTAHFDGHRWQRMPLPEVPEGASHGSLAELATVPGGAWLAGDRYISVHVGGAWHTTDLGPGHSIRDIQAVSTRNVWVVGASWAPGEDVQPVAKRWNGFSWEDEPPSEARLRLVHLYAESRNSLWAIGDVVPAGENGSEYRLLHWDGQRWQEVPAPLEGLLPQAINGDGRGGLWITGDPEGWEGPPVYWHHDGRRWTEVRGDMVTGGATQAYSIADLAPIGRTGRLWAVGSYSLLDGQGGANSYELIQRSTRR
ncbi:hypothetical protein [Streptomyces johnsoniae]|uniref:Secreted protein n=1 Tax=Streptomyces johnsoniae TaxID=3075532 RepID=A0ABU2SCM5_9ACTN|nr:hypothetical protein [Streptomyces sp. DSM 41886]MDT0446164.1 hypothetical protein [Streptomyces sp. DSM 41886]